MKITFEDVLSEVNISKQDILDLKIELRNAKKGEELPIILKLIGLADEVGQYYYKKIFYEDFFISIEEIAKHLDVSIRFVMNDIIDKLDRIEFPSEEFIDIKSSMKNVIFLNIGDSSKKGKNIYTSTKYSNEILKEKVKVLYRKKVLYSKESYIKFLKEHMKLLENNILINLSLEKEWIENIKVRLIKDKKVTNRTFINLLFNNFMKKNKREIEKYKANDIFDFNALIENRFGDSQEKRELTDFKSMNSLKVFFDKVYETEVTRAIEKSDYSFEFNLDLGRKKNIKRYILNSEFLLEKVKESFNFNIEEKSENEDDYEVFSAESMKKAKRIASDNNVDVTICDVNLPDGNGLEFVRWMRCNYNTYIICLTALDQEMDQVMGYEAGADDYITKPFSLSVLLLKIEAHFRRRQEKTEAGKMISGDIVFIAGEMKVLIKSREISLTKTELKMLTFFLQNPKQILSKTQILENVFDLEGDFVDENTIAVNIRRLREKIEDNPAAPVYIKNIRGLGYIWNQEVRQ